MVFKRTVMTAVGFALAVSVIIGCGPKADDAGGEQVTATFNVAGMTCEGCEEAIVHTVGRLDGVDMVESRHVTGTTTVLYRFGRVTRETIVKAIEGLGFTVVNPEE